MPQIRDYFPSRPKTPPLRAYSIAPSRNRTSEESISSVTLLPMRHFARVAEQAESGDIGEPVDFEIFDRLGGGAIQRQHLRDRAIDVFVLGDAALERRRNHARSDLLGEHQNVAGAGAGVGLDAVGMNRSGDRVSKFDFGIVDAMAAENDAARFVDFFRAALEDLFEDLNIARSPATRESKARSADGLPWHKRR